MKRVLDRIQVYQIVIIIIAASVSGQERRRVRGRTAYSLQSDSTLNGTNSTQHDTPSFMNIKEGFIAEVTGDKGEDLRAMISKKKEIVKFKPVLRTTTEKDETEEPKKRRGKKIQQPDGPPQDITNNETEVKTRLPMRERLKNHRLTDKITENIETSTENYPNFKFPIPVPVKVDSSNFPGNLNSLLESKFPHFNIKDENNEEEVKKINFPKPVNDLVVLKPELPKKIVKFEDIISKQKQMKPEPKPTTTTTEKPVQIKKLNLTRIIQPRVVITTTEQPVKIKKLDLTRKEVMYKTKSNRGLESENKQTENVKGKPVKNIVTEIKNNSKPTAKPNPIRYHTPEGTKFEKEKLEKQSKPIKTYEKKNEMKKGIEFLKNLQNIRQTDEVTTSRPEKTRFKEKQKQEPSNKFKQEEIYSGNENFDYTAGFPESTLSFGTKQGQQTRDKYRNNEIQNNSVINGRQTIRIKSDYTSSKNNEKQQSKEISKNIQAAPTMSTEVTTKYKFDVKEKIAKFKKKQQEVKKKEEPVTENYPVYTTKKSFVKPKTKRPDYSTVKTTPKMNPLISDIYNPEFNIGKVIPTLNTNKYTPTINTDSLKENTEIYNPIFDTGNIYQFDDLAKLNPFSEQYNPIDTADINALLNPGIHTIENTVLIDSGNTLNNINTNENKQKKKMKTKEKVKEEKNKIIKPHDVDNKTAKEIQQTFLDAILNSKNKGKKTEMDTSTSQYNAKQQAPKYNNGFKNSLYTEDGRPYKPETTTFKYESNDLQNQNNDFKNMHNDFEQFLRELSTQMNMNKNPGTHQDNKKKTDKKQKINSVKQSILSISNQPIKKEKTKNRGTTKHHYENYDYDYYDSTPIKQSKVKVNNYEQHIQHNTVTQHDGVDYDAPKKIKHYTTSKPKVVQVNKFIPPTSKPIDFINSYKDEEWHPITYGYVPKNNNNLYYNINYDPNVNYDYNENDNFNNEVKYFVDHKGTSVISSGINQKGQSYYGYSVKSPALKEHYNVHTHHSPQSPQSTHKYNENNNYNFAVTTNNNINSNNKKPEFDFSIFSNTKTPKLNNQANTYDYNINHNLVKNTFHSSPLDVSSLFSKPSKDYVATSHQSLIQLSANDHPLKSFHDFVVHHRY